MSLSINIYGIPIEKQINKKINLLKNPGFEEELTDWEFASPTGDYSRRNISYVNNPIKEGSKAIKFSGISDPCYVYQYIEITNNGTYKFGSWYINTKINSETYMYISGVVQETRELLNIINNEYIEQNIIFTTTPGNLELGFMIDSTTETNILYIDSNYLYKID